MTRLKFLIHCFILLLSSTGIAAHAPSRSGTQEINKSKSIDSAANAETFVTAGSLRLHYLDRGSGRPVIMIHGNAGDARDFDFGTLDLVARNYHVIAFDLPGHGFSKMGSRAKGTIQEQAETLHQALSTLGVRDPILVGHSWGGAIALAYALLYPDETCALVLLAPAAYSDGRHDAPLGLLMRLPLLSDACLALFKPIFGRRLLKKSLKDAFSPEPIPDEYLRVVAPVWLDRNHLKAFIKNDAMIDSSLRELSPRYGKILARVVIVTGDSDLAVSPEKNAFELHQVIKNSQLVVIPHAGHQIPQTNPEAVLKAVDMAAARTTLTNDIEKPQQQVAVSKGVANR